MTATTATIPTTTDDRAATWAARAALRITASELRLLLREPGVLVGLVAFPAVTVLILAGVFGTTPDPEFAGLRPSEHYVVGYLGVVLAQMGLVTLPAHITAHRDAGVLRRYRASGVGAATLVTSQALVGSVLGAAGALVVLLVGGAAYGIPAPDDLVAVVAWMVAGIGCFVAIGVALGTLLPSSRAANALGNLVFVPMFLLGGGGPPREVMTGAMQSISDTLPLTHVIGGLRHAWLGRTDDPRALWWTALLAVVAAGSAVLVARRRSS